MFLFDFGYQDFVRCQRHAYVGAAVPKIHVSFVVCFGLLSRDWHVLNDKAKESSEMAVLGEAAMFRCIFDFAFEIFSDEPAGVARGARGHANLLLRRHSTALPTRLLRHPLGEGVPSSHAF